MGANAHRAGAASIPLADYTPAEPPSGAPG